MSRLVTYRPFHGERVQEQGEVVVYFVYSAEFELLYVGQTNDVRRRLREHRRLSQWWPLADEVLYAVVGERGAALDAEADMIGDLAPLYNVIKAVSR